MVASTRKAAPPKLTPGVTPIGEWKKGAGRAPIELPSGKFMIISRHSFKSLLSSGVIPNSLMAVVQKSLDSGKNQVDAKVLIGDPEKMDEMLAMVDNITIFAVQEPPVLAIPENEKDRDNSQLYVDEIGDDDKAFIFQYVTGGTSDLERFREQSTELLVNLQSSKVVEVPAKSVTRAAPRRRR